MGILGSPPLVAVAVIALVIAGGRLLLRPLFQAIAQSHIQEIFTAAALLVVIGVSLLMAGVGLSMSLGAFLAGVLLADSEFRHELEANIEPFKGLLLGLFFISVGMSVDLGLIASKPFVVIGAVIGLMATKAAILFVIGKLSGHSTESARNLAAALSQGGEFAFVLFGVAAGHKIMDQSLVDLLVVVVTLSMAATPVALALNDALSRWLAKPKTDETFDTIDEDNSQVIIAGFGRVGQIVARVLVLKKIPFTALDASPEQVETVRRFGSKVYFGDASRLDLLTAAKTDKAKLFVLAIDDVESSIRTAEMVSRHFPDVKIYARARNRFHAHRLMDLGVELIERETVPVVPGLGRASSEGSWCDGMGSAGDRGEVQTARREDFDEAARRLPRRKSAHPDIEASGRGAAGPARIRHAGSPAQSCSATGPCSAPATFDSPECCGPTRDAGGRRQAGRQQAPHCPKATKRGTSVNHAANFPGTLSLASGPMFIA